MKKRVNYLSLRMICLIIFGLNILLISCKQREFSEQNPQSNEEVEDESNNQALSEKMNMISTLIGEDYTSNNRKEMQIMMSQLLDKLHYDSAYLFQYTYPIDGYKVTGAFFNYKKSKNGSVYGKANIYGYNGDSVKSFEIQNFVLPDSVFKEFRYDKINLIDEKFYCLKTVCY